MESMPRVPMITPDMKVPEMQLPADLIPKLREYILVHYNDDPTRFNDAFCELQIIRRHISRCSADVESICILKRYYSQLRMMKSRFPMEPGEQCSVPFSWSDRSLELTNSAVFEDVNFEMVNIMYNIGASHATIAVNETRADMDSIKNAFSHFQCAAGAFQDLINNNSAASFGVVSFEKSFLEFYLKVLLAQAQECLIEKAIIDKRMNTAVAKLACFASETYYELFVRLENPTIVDYVATGQHIAWRTLCGSKGHLYAAISRMHLGQHADDEKKYGEKLAHYAAALSHINDAAKMVEKDKRESLKQAVTYLQDIIVKREQSARKDNEFIYRERIPLAEELTQVEARTMVNAITFDPCDRSISGDDLFAALLPANVLKGVSEYSEEKARLKRQIVEKIEKRDDELDQYLWSMNFSELNLDQPEHEVQLPQELLDASAAFTTVPHAFSDLVSKLNDIADKSRKTDTELSELSRRLEAVKCPKLEANEGYQAISTRVAELKEHHGKARANNIELHKALADQSEQLKTLALPFHELAKHICNKVVNAADTPEGIALRKIIDKVDEMRRQRAALFMSLETEIENDDITSKVLADKNLALGKLFADELKKHDKSIKLIEMNLTAQDNILNKLTEANANFAELRQSIVENSDKRKKQCGKLIAAHEVFTGVKERTEAAETFFNQLFTLIRDLGKAVSIMEETFAGERERHEEQQKLVAERAQAYRERIAIESANPEAAASSTGERRRPKLADYMAYYRSKLAPGAQGQLPPPSSTGFQGYGNATTGPSPTLGRSSVNSLDSVNGPRPTSNENGLNEQIPPPQQGPQLGQGPPPTSMPQQFPGGGGQQFPPYGAPQQWQQQQQPQNMYAPPPASLQQPVPRPPISLQSQTSFPSSVIGQQPPQGQYAPAPTQHVPSTLASLASEPNSGLHTPAGRSSTATPVLPPQQPQHANSYLPPQQFGQSPLLPPNSQAPGVHQYQQFVQQQERQTPTFQQPNGIPLQQLPQIPNLQQPLNSLPTQQFSQAPTPQQPANPSPSVPSFLSQQQQNTIPTSQTAQQFGVPTSQFGGQTAQNQNPTSWPQGQVPQPTVQQIVPQVPPQQQPSPIPQQFRPSAVVPQPTTQQPPQGIPPVQVPQPLPVTSNAQQNGYQLPQQQHQPPQSLPQQYQHQASVIPPQQQQPPSTPQQFQPTHQIPAIPPAQQQPQQVRPTPQVSSAIPPQPQQPPFTPQQYPAQASVIPPQQQQTVSAPSQQQQRQKAGQDLMFPLAFDGAQGHRVQPLVTVAPKNLPGPPTSIAASNGIPPMQNVNHQPVQQVVQPPQNWMPQQSQPQIRPQATPQPPQQNPNGFQQQWQQPQSAPTPQPPQQQVQPSPKPDNVAPAQQQPAPVQPFTTSGGIAPSPYANMYRMPATSTASAAASPWHRNLPAANGAPTPAPANNAYVSPFAAPNRYQNGIQQPAAPSPFRPIDSGNNGVQNGNQQQRDITADLLDNLFAPAQTPLDFSRQHENHVGASGPSPQAMMCRPAATVLPMRRPDGTWSTGADDNNAILSFTNVQSVSVSEDGTERPVNGVGPL